jgi:antitoxin (DNA-binding transcriptional repressor) of toxin-antitoxin stability system
MKTVNIATLKDQLSAYLQEVRAGTEILVRDRNRVIARIVPFTPDAEDDDLEALAAEGKLRPAEGDLGNAFWKLPAPRVSAKALKRALDAERDEP